jgi:hypothetical protein
VTSKRQAYAPDSAVTEKWESGAYGRDEKHVGVVSADESAAVDDSIGLQLISIRLQKSLVRNLKLIAKHRGVSYQPLVRDLLNRFAASELKDIFHELEQAQRKMAGEENSIVGDFIAREQQKRRA